ncbi:MAG: hypothetical protein HY268_16430, partial [Deltaproteobacteria bacterium]|nr:hypothetical protein [Deltaproteobacteria bacterium]
MAGSIFVGKTIYTYDAQGHKTEEVLYSANGSPGSRIVYTYDAQGKRIQTLSSSFGRFGSDLNKTIYTYDDKGYLIEEVTAASYGVLGKTVYTYNDQGNLAEEAVYGPSGLKSQSFHTYDGEGRRLETTNEDTHGPALGIEKVVTTYDTTGNITEMTTYHTEKIGDEEDRPIPPPSKFVYTYEFDAHGNWVKQNETNCYTAASGEPLCEPPGLERRCVCGAAGGGGRALLSLGGKHWSGGYRRRLMARRRA